jgi:hypothetical protein
LPSVTIGRLARVNVLAGDSLALAFTTLISSVGRP